MWNHGSIGVDRTSVSRIVPIQNQLNQNESICFRNLRHQHRRISQFGSAEIPAFLEDWNIVVDYSLMGNGRNSNRFQNALSVNRTKMKIWTMFQRFWPSESILSEYPTQTYNASQNPGIGVKICRFPKNVEWKDLIWCQTAQHWFHVSGFSMHFSEKFCLNENSIQYQGSSMYFTSPFCILPPPACFRPSQILRSGDQAWLVFYPRLFSTRS